MISRHSPSSSVRAESRRVLRSWCDVPLVVITYTGYYNVGYGGVVVVACTKVGDEFCHRVMNTESPGTGILRANGTDPRSVYYMV